MHRPSRVNNPSHNFRLLRPMNNAQNPVSDSFAARLLETMRRLNLNEARAADYFGVPIFTLRKWCKGQREPSAVAFRLLDVLGMIEALAPALHDSFLPPAEQPTPRKRGRQVVQN